MTGTNYRLIVGIAAIAGFGLVGSVAVADVTQHSATTATTPVAISSTVKARDELATRLVSSGLLSQTGLRHGKSAQSTEGNDAAGQLVEELTDAQVLRALAAATPEALEASLFGSQDARDLLSTLVDRRTSVAGIQKALGSANADLVFTPLTPCRIMDTRSWSAGPLGHFVTRGFNITDAATIATQGGVASGGCGVPSVARAISVNITVASPAEGWLYFWPYGASQPNASVLNWKGPSTGYIANAAVLAVYPPGTAAYVSAANGGAGFTHVIMDVLGYFAPPVATALSCEAATSAMTAVPFNTWTNIYATCPAGHTLTGGGWWTSEGSLGWPGVWILSVPQGNSWMITVDNQAAGGSRNVQAWAQCCHVPGR